MNFRSRLEEQFYTQFQKQIESYEEHYLDYTLNLNRKRYLPDFRINGNTYIETKGNFSEQERDKMLAVTSQNKDLTIVMVFQNKHSIIPELNITYKEWCDSNNITCFGFQESLEIKMYLLKRKKQ